MCSGCAARIVLILCRRLVADNDVEKRHLDPRLAARLGLLFAPKLPVKMCRVAVLAKHFMGTEHIRRRYWRVCNL